MPQSSRLHIYSNETLYDESIQNLENWNIKQIGLLCPCFQKHLYATPEKDFPPKSCWLSHSVHFLDHFSESVVTNKFIWDYVVFFNFCKKLSLKEKSVLFTANDHNVCHSVYNHLHLDFRTRSYLGLVSKLRKT